MTNSHIGNLTQFINSNKVLLLALLLVLIASLPRLYNLGDLGFYGDEETTAFATRSMAEGSSPQMPSGMPYYRSLPYTWINSVSAKIFGLENEYSYRLPSALFGILTIPLLFLLARSYVGTSVAFLAALLLALSEWHIIISRLARMYGPFLFFYIASCFAILQWSKKDSFYYLALATLLFTIAAVFHNLGVFLAFVPLIALFIKGYATTPHYKLILFSIISGVSAYAYGQIFVAAPYTEWKIINGALSTELSPKISLLNIIQEHYIIIIMGVAASIPGAWLGYTSKFSDTENGKEFRTLTRYVLAVLFSCFAITGHLHGAFLSLLLLLLLYPYSLYYFLQSSWKPLLTVAAIASVTAVLTITEKGLAPGIKTLLMFPYPNWITFFAISAGITLLLFPAMLHIATKEKNPTDLDIRALLIISLLPLILVGIFMKWAAARYLIQAYPFILIIITYALYTSFHQLLRKRYPSSNILAFTFVCIITISGLLGGHGLLPAYKVATADYGSKFNESALIFPFYPDHKSPGEYVATHRSVNDIVIAEDVLEQRWYVGNVDYWLRKYNDDTGGIFIYKGKDKQLHDIYTGSTVATAEALNTIENDKSHKIWLITSGETYDHRDWYLTNNQLQWLKHIESTHTPVFTGKDDVTQVYCLNCETVKPADVTHP